MGQIQPTSKFTEPAIVPYHKQAKCRCS